MRLIMGILVTGMGFMMLEHTPWAFIQIVPGAFLIWRGVLDEIDRKK